MAHATAAPSDLAEQRKAARLGWYLSELRGRLKMTPPERHGPPRVDNSLPLGSERTWAEQLIELARAVQALAIALDVNPEVGDMPYHPKGATGRASDWLKAATQSLDDARSQKADVDEAWTAVAVAIASWDTKIQDKLADRLPLSAAYQLGRGLAEIRWAADATVQSKDDYRSIAYLLGQSRAVALDRLVDRSSEYYDPVTVHALRVSLKAWQEASESLASVWFDQLAEQATNWHDLVVGDRDGGRFVTPRDLLTHPATMLQVARHLVLEVSVMVVGAALLLVASWLLVGKQGPPQVGAVLGLLGILGISGATLAARARQAATGLLTHIQEKVYMDLAADRVTVTPPVQADIGVSAGLLRPAT